MNSLFFQNQLDNSVLTKRKVDKPVSIRSQYFRDTTAIIHSYPYRRLKHKTQVFFAPKNDHICTRIEHVMHVASISATICRALDLDADLAWAIGLGHDLGHTPFGHLGEVILSELFPRKNFRHEIYSLRVVDSLTNYGEGLNLTYAVRDGIINHCGEKFEQTIYPDFTYKDLSAIDDRSFYPSTWEGVVVRMSDKIAYLGRDLEDALQLGIITRQQIPDSVTKVLGADNAKIINNLVLDLIEYSLKHNVIGFSDKIFLALKDLKEFNYQNIYRSEVLSDYHNYFERILTTLHEYLTYIFHKFGFNEAGYFSEKNSLAERFYDYVLKMRRFYEEEDGGFDNVIYDYLAGMTDDYAIDCINEIMMPKSFSTQFDYLIKKRIFEK
ncbi:MAG: HD domain-containing protein [Spirochaetales bacterium]|nr:HD domain-containing protein [Spirochaetales bacterium]